MSKKCSCNIEQHINLIIKGELVKGISPLISSPIFLYKEMMRMDQEIWKDIPNYEGYYQVSSYGRFISKKNHILTQHLNKDGDLNITLSRDSKRKTYIAHKIVAQTFIPNPENLRYITHIDNNKQNNHIDNLRWAASYCRNVIYQFDKQGNFIAKYNSLIEAHQKTNTNYTDIYNGSNVKTKIWWEFNEPDISKSFCYATHVVKAE